MLLNFQLSISTIDDVGVVGTQKSSLETLYGSENTVHHESRGRAPGAIFKDQRPEKRRSSCVRPSLGE